MFRLSSKGFNTARMCLTRQLYPAKVALQLAQPILVQKFYSKDSKRPPPKFHPLKRGGVVKSFAPITRPSPLKKKSEPVPGSYTQKLAEISKIQSYQAPEVTIPTSRATPKEAPTSIKNIPAIAPPALPKENLKKITAPIFEKPNSEVMDTILKKKDGGEGEGGGDYRKGRDRAEDFAAKMMRYGILFGVVSGAGGAIYMFYCFGQPRVGADGQVIPDEFSEMPTASQYLYRAIAEMKYYNNLIKEPSREKLLPDPLPHFYQPPYTLVLEFTDLLVHAEWTYNTGWRFKKRPGLDNFLETLYSRYEVVVYTAEMGLTVFPLLETLDKNGLIAYRLVRDATHFVDGHHVKDLDKLNRDLKKVIVVDWNPESTKMHEANLFKIPRWDGNDDDTTLFDLTAFLMTIYEWEVEDIRNVLANYKSYADPLANFKERQKQLLAR